MLEIFPFLWSNNVVESKRPPEGPWRTLRTFGGAVEQLCSRAQRAESYQNLIAIKEMLLCVTVVLTVALVELAHNIYQCSLRSPELWAVLAVSLPGIDKRWHRRGLVCGGVRRYEPSLQCTQDVIYNLHILWSLLVFPWRCKLTSPLPNNLKTSREHSLKLREAQGVPLKIKVMSWHFSTLTILSKFLCQQWSLGIWRCKLDSWQDGS